MKPEKPQIQIGLDSRKLVLIYVSLFASTVVAYIYIGLIPTTEDFLEYFPDPSKIDPNTLVSIHFKHIDAIDSTMVNLFLFAGSIIIAYIGGNIWQKRIERNNMPPIRIPKEDEETPDSVPL